MSYPVFVPVVSQAGHGYGKGVSRVVGLGDAVEAQKALRHSLYLSFVGASRSAHGHLDLVGLGLQHFESHLGAQQHNDAARLPHELRGRYVAPEKKPFHTHKIREATG